MTFPAEEKEISVILSPPVAARHDVMGGHLLDFTTTRTFTYRAGQGDFLPSKFDSGPDD